MDTLFIEILLCHIILHRLLHTVCSVHILDRILHFISDRFSLYIYIYIYCILYIYMYICIVYYMLYTRRLGLRPYMMTVEARL